jgi:hypothetical protein
MDVARIFEPLSVGQRHTMIRAVRSLFNFYEAQGLASEWWLDLLRKNIPKEVTWKGGGISELFRGLQFCSG